MNSSVIEHVMQWLALTRWRLQLKSGFLLALSLCLTQQKIVGDNLCWRVLWNKRWRIWSMTVQKWHSSILVEQDQNLPGPNVACHPVAYVTYFELFLQHTYVRNSAAALVARVHSLISVWSSVATLQGFKCQFSLIFLYLCDCENSAYRIPYILSRKCLASYRSRELPWQEGNKGAWLVPCD